MPERRYGDDKTIHRTRYVDVEVDKNGKVVSVWFRCQHLPFKQSEAGPERAEDMQRMYSGDRQPSLRAVIVEDPK
jgi:hypothetical protein